MTRTIKINSEFCDYSAAIRIIKNENIRKDKPSKADYKKTRSLLKDFKIKCGIPEFQTVGELLRWRKEIIKERL